MQKPNNFLRFLGYVRPYWKYVLAGAVGGIVKFTVPLLTPQVTRHMLDHVYLNPAMTAQQKTHELLLYVGGMVAIFIFFWTPLTYVRHYYTSKAGHKSIFDLRCDLYDHILRMSASFFKRNQSGSVVARLISDIPLAQNLVGSALTNVWMDAISIIVVIYFMARIDVPAMIVALLTMPPYIYIFKKLGKEIKASTHQVQEEIAHISGHVQERVAGSAVIQAFTQEKKERQDFLYSSERLFNFHMRSAFYQSLNITLTGLLTNIAPLVVAMFSGYRVIQGQMSVGDLVAIGLYLGPLYLPVQRFSELNVVFANSMAALDRIFDMMDQPPEIRNKPDAIRLEQVEGRVEFDRVCFSYSHEPRGDEGPILRDISFVAQPGQKIALVGPSGSGKSTLVSLIPRFYDVESGAVYVDGRDVRDIKLKSLRRHIGMVMQDSILFSGTILENILYGNPQASEAEVIRACKAANAYEFIQALPKGFQTEIGESGAFLSGGQRQRLTIARAFLKNPEILILDEVTSALDAESEQLIQEALAHLMTDRTTFIIAHRLSTVVNADRILVLQEGRIAEMGTHAELMAREGVYWDLYTRQFASARQTLDVWPGNAPRFLHYSEDRLQSVPRINRINPVGGRVT